MELFGRWHIGVSEANPSCPEPKTLPSIKEFYEAFSGYAIALYISSAFFSIVLLFMFLYLVRHFFKFVPSSRRVPTLWVNSVYFVVALATTVCVVFPQSSHFVWLFYRVYLGMAMGYFVDLTLSWHGGETGMLGNIGEGKEINLRIRPCCLCFLCSDSTKLTRRKIRFFRGAVYQMPYIQSVMIFLMIVLNMSGFLVIGSLSPADPNLYLTVVILASFFFGLWGTFMFLDLTRRHDQLTANLYHLKSGLLKAIVILINMQGFILDSMGNYGIIPCIPPLISTSAMSSVIKSIMCLLESFALGTINFLMYLKDDNHF